jgi:hypothetical protein
MAPAPSKKRKTNVNDDDSRTIGKLLDVVIKHVGLLNGRMNKMEDKLDESLKLIEYLGSILANANLFYTRNP